MNTLAGIPLVIKRVRGARNYTLSYNAHKAQARLSLPMRAPMKEALEFATRKEAWLQKAIAHAPAAKVIMPGMELSVLGETLTFRHQPGRGLTMRTGAEVIVRGDVSFFERRVKDWLKLQLKDVLTDEVRTCVEQLNQARPLRVTIKHMSSRWGSCAHDGALAFAFRLVFCPPFVVRYLAAHECAHLVHMNHGPRFWKLVEKLDPGFKHGHAWLKVNGHKIVFQ